MANYGDPLGRTTDPVRQTDEYGNPIQQTGGHVLGTGAQQQQQRQGLGTGAMGKVGEKLHRSGSSSSSSSEDDGQGGRRKKGIKEKIKEKMPGGHRTTGPQATATTTPGAGGYGAGATTGPQGTATTTPGYAGAGATEGGEKKGIMGKIKEKLPGSHT